MNKNSSYTQIEKQTGLHEQPTYYELISYIERDPDKIKLPNRRAKQLRNTFILNWMGKE